ncbi:IS200/IS605 family transposase [Sediminicola luteus]|uniref:Transposase n=1 Tax=Sediminicola luteus TaxID=319238 RepID=A0A2A4G4A2_9FLAO|nr:IS200/IS605 family transposase [Sediminicola luteus]PCE63497.1 transposase [Sediminicola luteus]
MANTYTQLYFHVVFAVKGRANHISPQWKEELYKYISGVVRNKNQKLMIINGMSDHVHILLGTKPNCNLSDLVRDIKANSSKWINERRLVSGEFRWQTGFGAFTVGQRGLKKVIAYIENQEEHHKRKKFRKEYEEFLKTYGVDYDSDYLFEPD